MTYKVTIASAGGDDPIMAKSFIMACEGPATNWYSYLPPRSIVSWNDLKNKLRQDFQGFKRDHLAAADNFQCLQQDKEPFYYYFQRFIQEKAQTPNFQERTTIKKCIEGLLPGQLASHLSREQPNNL
jgi:hypothetical protein